MIFYFLFYGGSWPSRQATARPHCWFTLRCKCLCDIYYINCILQKSRNGNGWISYWPGCIWEWMELVLKWRSSSQPTCCSDSRWLRLFPFRTRPSPCGSSSGPNSTKKNLPHEWSSNTSTTTTSWSIWWTMTFHWTTVCGRSSTTCSSCWTLLHRCWSQQCSEGWGRETLQLSMHRVKRRCSFECRAQVEVTLSPN